MTDARTKSQEKEETKEREEKQPTVTISERVASIAALRAKSVGEFLERDKKREPAKGALFNYENVANPEMNSSMGLFLRSLITKYSPEVKACETQQCQAESRKIIDAQFVETKIIPDAKVKESEVNRLTQDLSNITIETYRQNPAQVIQTIDNALLQAGVAEDLLETKGNQQQKSKKIIATQLIETKIIPDAKAKESELNSLTLDLSKVTIETYQQNPAQVIKTIIDDLIQTGVAEDLLQAKAPNQPPRILLIAKALVEAKIASPARTLIKAKLAADEVYARNLRQAKLNEYMERFQKRFEEDKSLWNQFQPPLSEADLKAIFDPNNGCIKKFIYDAERNAHFNTFELYDPSGEYSIHYTITLPEVLSLVCAAVQDEKAYGEGKEAKTTSDNLMVTLFQRLQELNAVGVCGQGFRNRLTQVVQLVYPGADFVIDTVSTFEVEAASFLGSKLREAKEPYPLFIAWTLGERSDALNTFLQDQKETLISFLQTKYNPIIGKKATAEAIEIIKTKLQTLVLRPPLNVDPSAHMVEQVLNLAEDENDNRNFAIARAQTYLAQGKSFGDVAKYRIAELLEVEQAYKKIQKNKEFTKLLADSKLAECSSALQEYIEAYYKNFAGSIRTVSEEKKATESKEAKAPLKSLKDLEQKFDAALKEHQNEKDTINFVGNFFANWFVSTNKYALYRQLFIRRKQFIPIADSELDKMFEVEKKQLETIDEESKTKTISTALHVTLDYYKANRIFLHALFISPDEWTPSFAKHLEFAFNIVKKGVSTTSLDQLTKQSSYKEELLTQLKSRLDIYRYRAYLSQSSEEDKKSEAEDAKSMAEDAKSQQEDAKSLQDDSKRTAEEKQQAQKAQETRQKQREARQKERAARQQEREGRQKKYEEKAASLLKEAEETKIVIPAVCSDGIMGVKPEYDRWRLSNWMVEAADEKAWEKCFTTDANGKIFIDINSNEAFWHSLPLNSQQNILTKLQKQPPYIPVTFWHKPIPCGDVHDYLKTLENDSERINFLNHIGPDRVTRIMQQNCPVGETWILLYMRDSLSFFTSFLGKERTRKLIVTRRDLISVIVSIPCHQFSLPPSCCLRLLQFIGEEKLRSLINTYDDFTSILDSLPKNDYQDFSKLLGTLKIINFAQSASSLDQVKALLSVLDSTDQTTVLEALPAINEFKNLIKSSELLFEACGMFPYCLRMKFMKNFDENKLRSLINRNNFERILDLLPQENHKDFAKLFNIEGIKALAQSASSSDQVEKLLSVLDATEQAAALEALSVTDKFKNLINSFQSLYKACRMLPATLRMAFLDNLGIDKLQRLINGYYDVQCILNLLPPENYKDFATLLRTAKIQALLLICAFENEGYREQKILSLLSPTEQAAALEALSATDKFNDLIISPQSLYKACRMLPATLRMTFLGKLGVPRFSIMNGDDFERIFDLLQPNNYDDFAKLLGPARIKGLAQSAYSLDQVQKLLSLLSPTDQAAVLEQISVTDRFRNQINSFQSLYKACRMFPPSLRMTFLVDKVPRFLIMTGGEFECILDLLPPENHKDFAKLFDIENIKALTQSASSLGQVQKLLSMLDSTDKTAVLETLSATENFKNLINSPQLLIEACARFPASSSKIILKNLGGDKLRSLIDTWGNFNIILGLLDTDTRRVFLDLLGNKKIQALTQYVSSEDQAQSQLNPINQFPVLEELSAINEFKKAICRIS